MADSPEPLPVGRRISACLFGSASNRVFRGMATMAVGSGIGRMIGIAVIPILTRLYSPEDFGILAVFTALVAILGPLVTLRYVLALPLPRHDGVAMNLLVLSTGLMLGLTVLVALVLWLWGTSLFALVSMEVLAPWWWLVALGVLGTATYEMLTMWATRKRAYSLISQSSIMQSAAGAAVKITLGLLSLQPMGLIIGQFVAQSAGTTRILRNFKNEFQVNWRHVNIDHIRKVIWKHRGFAIWQVPSQFLMTLSMHAPVFFMSAIFDLQTVGNFSIAVMALSVPVAIVSYATAQAFFAEASAIGPHRTSELREMLSEVTRRLVLLSFVPTLVVLIFAKTLFPSIFGDNWVQAGEFAQALSVSTFFQFIQTPSQRVFILVGTHHKLLAINIQRVGILFLVLGSAKLTGWSPSVTVWVYALSMSGHYALGIIYAYNCLPKIKGI